MAKKQQRNDEVYQQSINAYNQWKEKWRAHAKLSRRWAPFKSFRDFMNIGVGRAVVCVANGYSFEEHIETLIAHAGNVDIMCCDKTLGHLLDNGIKPTYCLVADAVVDYEKYMKPWEQQLQDTYLFSAITANPKWSLQGNWKDRYFYANLDCLGSEKEFMELSGCSNLIPAATNVSNAMVVALTQSDNNQRMNYFGYDKILLVGYDYSWRHNGGYYAFDHEAGGKRYYMKHVYICTKSGNHGYTSTNLMFSARWLDRYIQQFNLPVVNCSQETLLSSRYSGNLAEQMQYRYKPEDGAFVREQIAMRDKLMKEAEDIAQRVMAVGNDHYYNFIGSM